MSHWAGKLAHLQIPQQATKPLIRAFAHHYKINPEEVEKPLGDYKTLGEFFSRKLKPGLRPIQAKRIHPCDGLLIESGKIFKDSLIQAKGRTYSLSQFLPDNPWEEDFKEGSFFTYYLAPHNYHRVHMPVSGQVEWSAVVPGELWPVNAWSVKNIKNLYVVNERVLTGIQCDQKKLIVAMVGATNVGSISMSYDVNIQTNRVGKKERVHRQYDGARALEVGEELGTFHLGSTVVLLFDKNWNLGYQERKAVKMGEKL